MIPQEDRAPIDPSFLIQCGNAALFILLCLLIYSLLTIHLPEWAHWFATGVAGSSGGLLAFALVCKAISTKPFEHFLSQVAGVLEYLTKNRQVTLFLSGAVVVGLLGTGSDLYLHYQFPVLRIVPGPRLTDMLCVTGVTNQQVYEIVVSLGRKTRGGELQWAEEAQFFPLDASSISIGASKYFLRWRATRDLNLADKQVAAPIDDDKVIARCKQNPVFLATRRLRVGDKIRISFRCRRDALLLFQSPDEILTSDQPNLKEIELEPTQLDEFFQKVRQCEPTSS